MCHYKKHRLENRQSDGLTRILHEGMEFPGNTAKKPQKNRSRHSYCYVLSDFVQDSKQDFSENHSDPVCDIQNCF